MTEDELEALEADVEAEIEDAVKFADESPEPALELLEPTTYNGPFATMTRTMRYPRSARARR